MAGTVTSLKPKSGRKGRIHVHLDGTYAFSLAGVLAASLRLGQELSEEAVEALKQENMIRIVRKFITQLNQMSKLKNVHVLLDDSAEDYLARKGYDPKMGARPLARLIQNELSQPLSREMLFGDLKRGGTALVSAKDDALVIDIQGIPAPEAEMVADVVL